MKRPDRIGTESTVQKPSSLTPKLRPGPLESFKSVFVLYDQPSWRSGLILANLTLVFHQRKTRK